MTPLNQMKSQMKKRFLYVSFLMLLSKKKTLIVKSSHLKDAFNLKNIPAAEHAPVIIEAELKIAIIS